MSAREKAQVLDETGLDRALTRIAHEIVERNRRRRGLALVGIRTRGVTLAQRLAAKIAAIEGTEPRRWARSTSRSTATTSAAAAQPVVRRTEIPFPIKGKTVVLVDDVLFTGRTVRAAMDALIDLGRPRDDPARRPGRPRPARAADPARLRRQEPADDRARDRARCCSREHDGEDRVVDRRTGARPDMGWTRKDLLGDARPGRRGDHRRCSTRRRSLRRSPSREIKKVPTLRGKTVVNLFSRPRRARAPRSRSPASGCRPTSINFSGSRLAARARARRCIDTAQEPRRPWPRRVVVRHSGGGRRRDPGARTLRVRGGQRGRRRARAPDAGAARPAHDPRAQGPTSTG